MCIRDRETTWPRPQNRALPAASAPDGRDSSRRLPQPSLSSPESQRSSGSVSFFNRLLRFIFILFTSITQAGLHVIEHQPYATILLAGGPDARVLALGLPHQEYASLIDLN